jgi:hypothetical protein
MVRNEHLWRGSPYNTQRLHEDQKLKNGWLQTALGRRIENSQQDRAFLSIFFIHEMIKFLEPNLERV